MDMATAVPTVAVFGAYGHTGRFVVRELLDRGLAVVAIGRDADKLRSLATDMAGEGVETTAGEGVETMFGAGVEIRPASVDDPASLDRALSGAQAVINCAGPFATTAAPVIEAALRAGIPYVDVAAEIEANADTFAHFEDRARKAGALIVPAMAFYGGLGDLLTTAAMGDWTKADEVHIAYALSHWHPTEGTRAAGQISRSRRSGRRVRFSHGRLEYRDDAPPTAEWTFPDPLGTQPVIAEFTMADVVTVPSHVPVPEVRTYMTATAARDVVSSDAPPPSPVDERGRSDQTFVVDVVVRTGDEERRASASGQDIYAVTAPLVVEAVERILSGRVRGDAVGVVSAGALFDAADFLSALKASDCLELLQ
ncbi:saccharopine dehydrogenase family protein [Streptomyces lincolnensis]|uniref:saccharopine dehydrogenase family protein n=1 Tax=Streptomyces lincolnensis TaxID=1915 RepID=UPI0037D3A61E